MAGVYRITSKNNDSRNTTLKDKSGKDLYIVNTKKDLTTVTVVDSNLKEGSRTLAFLHWKGHEITDVQLLGKEPVLIDDFLVPAFSADGDKGVVKTFSAEGKKFEWHMKPAVSELRPIPAKQPLARAHGMIRHTFHKNEEPFIEILHDYIPLLDDIILTWIVMESHHQVLEHQEQLQKVGAGFVKFSGGFLEDVTSNMLGGVISNSIDDAEGGGDDNDQTNADDDDGDKDDDEENGQNGAAPKTTAALAAVPPSTEQGTEDDNQGGTGDADNAGDGDDAAGGDEDDGNNDDDS